MAQIPVILCLLAGPCLAQQVSVDLVNENDVRSRLERGAVAPKERQAAIRALFNEVGCTAEEQPVDKSAENVVCTLPWQTDSTIIVGGHFDFVDLGKGIVDDWSGTALLPSLYAALKGQSRQHTYVFIAFAVEERGLVGSSRYVKSLTDEPRLWWIDSLRRVKCWG